MNEKLNMVDSNGSHPIRNIDPSLAPYLLEAALDREWEHRHGQGQFGKAPGMPAEEEMMS
ncbi:hypothetical protein [uncultured Nitrospira sp.]|uniref:hypothetical protein n=1 Tax=uncultured Nitrospira sp. TaxID=157176 RepID=UPI0031407464